MSERAETNLIILEGMCLPFHTDQLEITTKVPSIQATDWQSVPKASHGSLEVVLIEIRIQIGRLIHGSVHVRPHQRDGRTGYATTLLVS